MPTERLAPDSSTRYTLLVLEVFVFRPSVGMTSAGAYPELMIPRQLGETVVWPYSVTTEGKRRLGSVVRRHWKQTWPNSVPNRDRIGETNIYMKSAERRGTVFYHQRGGTRNLLSFRAWDESTDRLWAMQLAPIAESCFPMLRTAFGGCWLERVKI